jgi:hypothetical protein
MSNPEYTALIEGHADEQGTREYNLALGARRAASVRDYLVSQGVSDGAAEHDQLRQGAPARDLFGGKLLPAEPPRRDGDCGRVGGLIPCAVSAPSLRADPRPLAPPWPAQDRTRRWPISGRNCRSSSSSFSAWGRS